MRDHHALVFFDWSRSKFYYLQRLHVHDYVDVEDFYTLPLEDCDVVFEMLWFHRVKVVPEVFDRKIILKLWYKDTVLGVKLKGKVV